jgi:PPM family protein phosphatase
MVTNPWLPAAHRASGTFLLRRQQLFCFSEDQPDNCALAASLVYNVRAMLDVVNLKPGMEVASLTDVGRLRENNEDSCLYWEPASDAEFERKGRLAIIADGMGGYEGGLEASRLAAETVREVYASFPGEDPRAALLHAFGTAHRMIQSYAVERPELHGMGTTCTAAVVRGPELFFAHVGDSRLYLVRDRKISRLTRDHSYVGRLVESGIVRPEDAEKHPQRHILTSALGAGLEVDVESPQIPTALQTSDNLLLCTDGLWGVVSESEIENAASRLSPAECCSALVKLALQNGGPDNVTVQVLRVTRPV